MSDLRQPQPDSECDRTDSDAHNAHDLDLTHPEGDSVRGGDGTPPREVSSGVATGHRTYNPGNV